MNNAFVAVDWGTTSLRAYTVDRLGHVVQSIKVERGVQSRQQAFEATLGEALSALADAVGLPVLMAGMIGSRQGWVEAPYVAAPCNVDALAQQLTDVPTSLGRSVKIVPGVSDLSKRARRHARRGNAIARTAAGRCASAGHLHAGNALQVGQCGGDDHCWLSHLHDRRSVQAFLGAIHTVAPDAT